MPFRISRINFGCCSSKCFNIKTNANNKSAIPFDGVNPFPKGTVKICPSLSYKTTTPNCIPGGISK